MTPGTPARAGAAWAVSCAILSCTLPSSGSIPFDARPGPGSGDGVITLEPAVVEASQEMRLRLIWTTGPQGLRAGGGFSVSFPLQPEDPLSGFTRPHDRVRTVPGFVQCWARRGELLTDEADTEVVASGASAVARCTLRSGELRPGDGLAMDYWGLAPRTAGRYELGGASRMWGARGAAPLAKSASLEVKGRPARALTLVLPSTARPGEPVAATLRLLDEFGNLAEGYAGEVEVTLGTARRTVRLVAEDRGVARLEGLAAPAEGVARAEAVELGDMPEVYRLRTTSNLMRVMQEAPR